MEVFEYLRHELPWLFDEGGNLTNLVFERLSPDRVWVRPEEIMELREKLLNTS
jgi:hypothetical protein